jgi:hypothetical protein
VGDFIHIEPGTKTTLFSDMQADIGKIALLIIVADNFETNTDTPILGFVAFKVTDAQGGSAKYVQGYFVKNYVDYDATSGGTNYFGASGTSISLVR